MVCCTCLENRPGEIPGESSILSGSAVVCPSGETGKRTIFRMLRRKAWRFDSSLGHLKIGNRTLYLCMRYTKEMLEEAVKDSLSFSDVLRKLGIPPVGNRHTHIANRIRKFGIDTNHFLGRAANSGINHKGGPEKRTWQSVLAVGKIEKAVVLRRAMIESGRQYKCECKDCPIADSWLGKAIRLQINHKDANRKNNTPENVEFLCPNCHSQTETWGCNTGHTDLTTSSRYDKEYRKRGNKV